jgi:hypothetical protein
MTEKSRTVLIALGVSLLVVVLAPLLLCLGTMAGMGDLNEIRSMMDGTGRMMSGGPMITGGVVPGDSHYRNRVARAGLRRS